MFLGPDQEDHADRRGRGKGCSRCSGHHLSGTRVVRGELAQEGARRYDHAVCSNAHAKSYVRPNLRVLLVLPSNIMYEKTLVAQIKSNLLLNIQIYNMSSFQIFQFKGV